jgi:hypothetical protein
LLHEVVEALLRAWEAVNKEAVGTTSFDMASVNANRHAGVRMFSERT